MPASRSLIALLVGTVAFFALWMLALKGGSSNNSSSGGGTSTSLLQSAVSKAHQAVQTSNASNAASGNDGTSSSPASATASSTSASTPHTGSSTSSTTASTKSPKPTAAAKSTSQSAAAANRLSTVKSAVSAHKVVAMLFYNPAAADDQAVKQELAAVAAHRGKVVKLAIPLNEAAHYTAVTQQVPVNLSPTLVLIDPSGQASEIVGFSDKFEIAARVSQALATK